MRRTCVADVMLGGQQLRKGDKVVMWYISANRDESIFPNASAFDVTRENARRHIGFGHGVHRCVGARLAEMQLAIYIEEIVKRNLHIEKVGEPERMASCFLHGFNAMPVRMTAR
jgi:cytochrome P450